MSFGVFPPPLTLLEHLYELGYQDMETWLQNHLEERLDGLNSNEAGWRIPTESEQWNWANLLTKAETFRRKMPDETFMIVWFLDARSVFKNSWFAKLKVARFETEKNR